MGNYIRNEPCPECSSTGMGKSLAVYDDGQYCNQCGYTNKGECVNKIEIVRPIQEMIPVGSYKELPARHITKEACEKYKYSVSEYKGQICRVASFYKQGAVVAQKLKIAPKKGETKSDYRWLGNRQLVSPLFGMDLFEPNEKLSITITEGEDDCVALASSQGCKWPIVSLLNGAGGQTKKEIAQAKEYLCGFKKIILMFDGDEVGRKAAEECAELLGPKARIAQMPDGMDVCDILKTSGGAKTLQDLSIRAVSYRPKDIVTISDYTEEELYQVEDMGVELPFPRLNKLLRGLKAGRLYTICAGSGLGKSTLIKELAYDLMFKKDISVGIIFLEQDDKEAMKDFIAMDNNIEAEEFCQNKDLVPEEKRQESARVLTNHAVFYKFFGSLDTDKLISKIEYMINGYGCEYIFLDHISMAVSGQSSPEGERKDIDILMTKLRTLVQNTGKSVIAVSHLKRPQHSSKCYNEGATVNLLDLRGSASLEQISDFVIALERNQFSEINPNIVSLKVLKSRRGGHIGYADELEYNEHTGRLEVV